MFPRSGRPERQSGPRYSPAHSGPTGNPIARNLNFETSGSLACLTTDYGPWICYLMAVQRCGAPKSKLPMTNDKRSPNSENAREQLLLLKHSSFEFVSDFVIRHSDFDKMLTSATASSPTHLTLSRHP